MDTSGIRLFVLAADLLNISAAGRQLGMVPAVASARLSKLEHQLGADLLHRSTRKVSLSTKGAEFLPFAREILAQEEAARAMLGLSGEEVSGTLRFAASSTFAQLYVVPILPEFLDRYPDINLELRLSDAKINLFEAGLDLALRNDIMEDSSLRARKLADDTRILCASPDYLTRLGTPQHPTDLAHHQLLTFMHRPARKLKKRGASREYLFPPPGVNSRMECDDGTSMKLATLAGMGISMNSVWSVDRELREGSLVRVLPDYEVGDAPAIWLVYPKSNVLSARVRVFIDFLVEKIGDPPLWEH